ncbi:ABC transporter permease [Sphingomicrobium aestuariivivum]|uniref:ABC transporter permease n=1 Tax=Sphingomicrobium aestuariivivum TaxID=1582356 RepID=UPI001FD71E7F|nr:ABC transporter permease [Sphingomicrobium aestuariivivum]MCJ8191586.1 ABC transporter permease [Sphingomicrobium aestuariivivum]
MLSVWKALFLREAGVRLFGSRAAWVWLLIEPVVHVAFISFLFGVVRQTQVAGIDTVIFLVLGLNGFFLFRRAAGQMGGGVDSNRALFTYRQVTPFDTIIVRGLLEWCIMIATFVLTLFGLLLLEYDVMPADPMTALAALVGLWLLGAGLGIIIAMAGEIAGEVRQILTMAMMPLYFLSAVIFPLTVIPPEFMDAFLVNPIPHGLETLRHSFTPHYRSVPGIELSYLYIWAACFWGFGLLLYRNFSYRIVAE